ncbi:GNAT family N-acetyltransferase, partial [Candidatus Bipolaricaulota bacterium]|nr:GNAT family N-acetyltransferase [Candidatus Bipolaricaulota bacterium]
MAWHDDLNRIGLLEPVGIHPDHRRCGLGKAVVVHALHCMKTAGMEVATVANTGTNDASLTDTEAVRFDFQHLGL